MLYCIVFIKIIVHNDHIFYFFIFPEHAWARNFFSRRVPTESLSSLVG